MASPARRIVRGSIVIVLVFAVAGAGYAAYRWHEARTHLQRAKSALDDYRYDDAFAEMQRCTGYYAERGDVQLLAARIARRSAHIQEAERYLEASQALLGETNEEVRLEHQLLAAQEGKASDFATKSLWERAEKDPDNRVLIYEALLQGAMRTFRGGQARAVVDAWLSAPTRDPRPYYWKGLIYNQMYRKGEDAVRGFTEAIERDPNYYDARLSLAELYLEAADGQAAEPHFRHLETIRPGAPVFIGLGRCRAAAGDYAQAEKLLRAAVKDEPDNVVGLRELGIVLMYNGPLEESLACLKRAAELWPHDVPTSYNLYLVYQRLRQDSAAEQQLAKHKTLEDRQKQLNKLLFTELQQRPGDVDVMHQLGKVQLQIGGRVYEAQGLWWLQRVLQLMPQHKKTYAVLADYYERNGNHDMAERCRRMAE